MFDDIKAFHEKFQLPPLANPGFLDEKTMSFRIKFMEEELEEFKIAYATGNLHDAFDALIDLMYVTLGTGYLMKLPIPAGWDVVHEANMKKVRATHESQSKRGSTSDVVKPQDWEKPDLSKLIKEK